MDTNTATLTAATYVVVRYDRLNVSAYRVTPLEDGLERVEYLDRDSAAYAEALATTPEVGRWTSPAIVAGIHKATLTITPAQAELKARAATNPANPAKGDRYIVSTLTGYELVQNRPFEHRDCSCGRGVTTYAEGTVTAVSYYMDNSVEATVTLDDGDTRIITLVAPHGDVCY